MGCTRVTHHPTTAIPLAGFRLPFWEAAKELVEKAAILFLPMRCIGWDVAITPSGPVLLEANMWWGPHNALAFPSRSGGGLADLLERLEAAARRGRIDWKG